jgi:hypothetical protein
MVESLSSPTDRALLSFLADLILFKGKANAN